ncbi:hypothetical protein rpr22_0389 [Rickettsia prowazekii str. Rp22]|uniref:Uncharacterized protein n=1 Tax=Rickettsia prowazekii (strain Rp22) TaxID=449216 RepID=D5AWV3_RICPP|nr:hypothetical protein rpr22_0389 [Rickettsia prowazekii str. Rp22]AGJ02467.1 hypothetical protein H375_2410 [Rickettsia prowazekii str. Breinl]AMS12279.1 hypothetical protein AR462_01875 [Rickettsia prowazekii]
MYKLYCGSTVPFHWEKVQKPFSILNYLDQMQVDTFIKILHLIYIPNANIKFTVNLIPLN